MSNSVASESVFKYGIVYLLATCFLVTCTSRCPQDVESLVAALKDQNEDVRKAAARTLGDMGPNAKAAVPALIDGLKDENLRFNAAIALGQIGTASIAPLIEALKDHEEDVRKSAASALGQIGPDAKAARPHLVDVLEDENAAVRASAARALGQIGPIVEAFLHLIDALEDPNDHVSESAAHALEQIGPNAKASVSRLVEALKDRSAYVRLIAARTLGQIGPDANVAVPDLIEVMKDPERDVRQIAREALGQIGPGAEAAVPHLVEVLKDRNSLSAAHSLVQIGTAAVPHLINVLQEQDEHIRGTAARVLGQMGPDAKAAIPNLIETLNDPNEKVRRYAAFGLGRIGPEAEAAVPHLIKALKDQNFLIRSSAIIALRTIGPKGKTAVPNLTEALNDAQVRRWTVEEGAAAPDFQLELLDGITFNLASYVNHSIVVLNFWATWCHPCLEELPLIDELYTEYQDQGVAFFAVNHAEQIDAVRSFVERTELAMPVALDTEGKASVSLPTVVIVDKLGTIAAVEVGFYPDIKARLKKEFNSLLSR